MSWCWIALVAREPPPDDAAIAVAAVRDTTPGDAAIAAGAVRDATPGDAAIAVAAVRDATPGDAAIAAAAVRDPAPAGFLAAWAASDRPPRPGALRACRWIVDPDGAPARVSLVLAPPGRRLAFDDPAVQQARRRVLAEPPADAVSTLLSDDSRFEGAITVWRGRATHDDPFARIFPARLLEVGAGLIGRHTPPCGPTIERYGSATPWPWDRFPR